MRHARTALQVLATAAAYYSATRIAWLLTFPDSNVSLFFPPHAVLVAVLLLVPTRHWWAYTLAAAASHFIATQQANWPVPYALHAEAFDAVKNLLAAAAIRTVVKSPFDRITLREAVRFVLVAVIIVPFATAFWGAAFTVSNGFALDYWVQWRDLGISNGVTAMVLVPAILIGAHKLTARRFTADPRHAVEAGALALSTLVVGWVAFNSSVAAHDASPALLYAPIPLLVWAALRFGLGGVSATMLVITLLAIWGTMHGHGPFLAQTPAQNATALQLFLLMAATPLMLLAVAIDEERRLKEALVFSEERVKLAEHGARLAMWEWDITNDKVWITDEGRKFFGFEPGEHVDVAQMGAIVHPDDEQVRAASIRHAVETSGFYESEMRIVRRDGSVRWIVARGRAGATGSDESKRIIGVSIDISRQKQAAAEAQLQREELAHLARVASVSALSSSLAHELGQPLGSIIANAQAGQRLLSHDVADTAQLRAIFADLVGAGRHAGDIIERLRTMLRRGRVAVQPLNVNENIDELLRLTRSDLIARGVTVTNETSADLPAALTDRIQLQQVLLNLILNACDAMASNAPDDRAITLTTAVVEDEVRIAVLDRGVGLPGDIESVFQPFYTTKPGGLGLGLSICRTLVTAQGGRLWAERRAERGATFYVALPIAGAVLIDGEITRAPAGPYPMPSAAPSVRTAPLS